MNFVCLTSDNGKSVFYVNLDTVARMQRDLVRGDTLLRYDDGMTERVQETPEDILTASSKAVPLKVPFRRPPVPSATPPADVTE